MIRALLIAAALPMFVFAAHAEDYGSGPVKMMKTANGQVLTDAKGMTLYTFDKDDKGVSNCTGQCAAKWPPMKAKKSATASGEFSVIKRKDGSRQWAYDGKPLYRWQNDKKPGDMTGDGVGGVWHVATE
ncbi:MAG: COG4315 family predicted lipoprotein [Pararhizobium sp.]